MASICRPVIVVLGAHFEQARAELANLPVTIVENAKWAEGMSSSIRAGVRTLLTTAGDVEGVVLMLCDQPLIECSLINKLVEAHASSGQQIIAAEYDGIRGVPALFARSLFSELLALAGPEGARSLMRDHDESCAGLPVPEAGVDVDTPDDYNSLTGDCRRETEVRNER